MALFLVEGDVGVAPNKDLIHSFVVASSPTEAAKLFYGHHYNEHLNDQVLVKQVPVANENYAPHVVPRGTYRWWVVDKDGRALTAN